MKEGEKATLSLYFLPLRVGQSSCRLQFYDDKAGEFSYSINVDVSPPPPLEIMKLLCEEHQSCEKGILFSVYILNNCHKIFDCEEIILQLSNPLLIHAKEMVNRLVGMYALFVVITLFISRKIQLEKKGYEMTLLRR